MLKNGTATMTRHRISAVVTALVLTGGLAAWAAEVPVAPTGVLHRVAYEDCGRLKEFCFVKEFTSGTYPVYQHTYMRNDIPDSAAVTPAMRTIIYGDDLLLGFGGMNPKAEYILRLVFLASEKKPAAQRVFFNGKRVGEDAVLKSGVPVERRIAVPAELLADGELAVKIVPVGEGRVRTPLAEVEMLSTDPTPIHPTGDGITYPEVRVPVYRPVPVTVAGIAEPVLSLCGTWQFAPNPAMAFFTDPAQPLAGAAEIEVPGEWAMQGFAVSNDRAAGYRRTFRLPADWKGARVILRADAVYSDCAVWVNGRQAGSHVGGFTPVELDVTDFVLPGENTLALAVKNESAADSLASGSKYAVHPLGGITRKIRLFAVPPIHVTLLHVATELDPSCKAATVKAQAAFRNETQSPVTANCTLEIRGPWLAGRAVSPNVETPVAVRTEAVIVKPGGGLDNVFALPLSNPALWHTEHPNLYRARLTLAVDGRPVETVECAFGCRKVEVRGNQLLVNGAVQKLFGACRHETHPLRGRSLAGDLWRKDVELYQAANVNILRTSHYPPAEELFDAADELGMFVECEAPFCWANFARLRAPDVREATVRQTLEMAQFLRGRASILYWSLGNESEWNTHFKASSKALRELDPTRPQTFEFLPGPPRGDEAHCEIASTHYPGPSGPGGYRNSKRPVSFGEYCHLNAYNRFELATDPGLREAWGRLMSRMVDAMRETPSILGGSVWAAMDDTFFVPPPRGSANALPSVVGYGTWGPLDGWRRQKPEYWHMKKAYSPVRLLTQGLELSSAGGAVSVKVANRHLFTNLRDLRVEWQAGTNRGSVQADVAPGTTGTFTISVPPLAAGQSLLLRFVSPLGFVVDESVIGTVPGAGAAETPGTGKVVTTASELSFEFGPGLALRLARDTGLLSSATMGGKTITLGGPHLMLLPLNHDGETQMTGKDPVYPLYSAACGNWRPRGPSVVKDGVAIVSGSYDEAEGTFTYRLKDGHLEIAYAFTCLKDINPRQVGLVFDLPGQFQSLSWKRRGVWSYYPADHIGRLQGVATAFPAGVEPCSQVGPKRMPAWPWKDDTMPAGSNDFRSTKENILSAGLSAGDGVGGVEVLSDGSQHVRAWVDGEKVRLLVADYSNAGAERYFGSHAQQEYKPLKKGDQVRGIIRLRFGNRPIHSGVDESGQ